MEITEVRIKLMDDSDDRLQAFCSITFDDCFVIRDLKIIDGSNGPFVAMPSRKLTAHCQRCGAKNHMRSAYCNHCGGKQREERRSKESDGRSKLYADIAHPINSECREMIQQRVIDEFQYELERAKQPGYASRYDEAYGEADGDTDAAPAKPKSKPTQHAHIEPAETQVPAPHTPRGRQASDEGAKPKRQRTKRSPKQREDQRNDDGFGAGIFD